MTILLYSTGIILAIVSATRSVLWLLSLASPALIDQGIAVLGGIGLTLGMYGLSARTALAGISDNERHNLNITIAGLLLVSIYASFDWAESGFQSVATMSKTDTSINSELQHLLTDTRAISQNQQENANALAAIGHNSKSNRITSNATDTIETRRELLADLQKHQMTNQPSTGSSATLLGDSRFILWILLATLLDWAGMTAARIAAADTQADKKRRAEEKIDPLLERISAEIKSGDHGEQPAVVHVAKHHKQPDDRIRLIFQQLMHRGELIRPGIRYQRVTQQP